jgi:N-methylhydantoinase A
MVAPFDAERMNAVFDEMEAKATEQLRSEGFADADIALTRLAEMKFSLQIHQVEVPVPSGTLTASDATEQVGRFIDRYEQIYGKGAAFPSAGTSIGLFKVLARGQVRTPVTPPIEQRELAPAGQRPVYWRTFGEFVPTQIYDGSKLSQSADISGPAILEFPDTTVVVPPGATAGIDQLGNVLIDVGVELPTGTTAQAAVSV